jgi:hypothetical protein
VIELTHYTTWDATSALDVDSLALFQLLFLLRQVADPDAAFIIYRLLLFWFTHDRFPFF